MTDPFVRPDVAAFLAYLNGSPAPRLSDMGAVAARQAYAAARDLTDLPLGELATVRELAIPCPAGELPARLFDPRPSRAPGPVVLFFHGGGFVIGSVDTHAPLCAEIARALDLPVVSVDYRLAPEHPWPAAPDDAEAAARWLAAGPATLERGVSSLVVMGDSAGAALAIIAAQASRDRPAARPVIAQGLLYPPADWTRDYPSQAAFADGYLLTEAALRWFDAAYRADPHDPRGSPLLAPLAGLPPAVIATAALDPIRDQGRAYAAGLASAGVQTVFREAAGTIHGFATLRRAIPSAAGDVAGFLAALKAVIVEAEAARVMTEAA